MHTYYHQNGEPFFKTSYRQNVKHGPYKQWNSEGRLVRSGNYKNDKAEGWFYEYTDNCHLKSMELFQNDVLHGPAYYWKEDGSLYRIGYYEHNLKQGNWFEWNPQGMLVMKGHFEQGRMHGLFYNWDDKGRFVTGRHYRDDSFIRTDYYKRGKLKYTEESPVDQ